MHGTPVFLGPLNVTAVRREVTVAGPDADLWVIQVTESQVAAVALGSIVGQLVEATFRHDVRRRSAPLVRVGGLSLRDGGVRRLPCCHVVTPPLLAIVQHLTETEVIRALQVLWRPSEMFGNVHHIFRFDVTLAEDRGCDTRHRRPTMPHSSGRHCSVA